MAIPLLACGVKVVEMVGETDKDPESEAWRVVGIDEGVCAIVWDTAKEGV